MAQSRPKSDPFRAGLLVAGASMLVLTTSFTSHGPTNLSPHLAGVRSTTTASNYTWHPDVFTMDMDRHCPPSNICFPAQQPCPITATMLGCLVASCQYVDKADSPEKEAAEKIKSWGSRPCRERTSAVTHQSSGGLSSSDLNLLVEGSDMASPKAEAGTIAVLTPVTSSSLPWTFTTSTA